MILVHIKSISFMFCFFKVLIIYSEIRILIHLQNFEYHIAFFLFPQEWLEKKNVYLHEMHRIKRIESENLRIQNEQVF